MSKKTLVKNLFIGIIVLLIIIFSLVFRIPLSLNIFARFPNLNSAVAECYDKIGYERKTNCIEILNRVKSKDLVFNSREKCFDSEFLELYHKDTYVTFIKNYKILPGTIPLCDIPHDLPIMPNK